MKPLWTNDDADTISLHGMNLTDVPGLERCQRVVRARLSHNLLRAIPAGVSQMSALR